MSHHKVQGQVRKCVEHRFFLLAMSLISKCIPYVPTEVYIEEHTERQVGAGIRLQNTESAQIKEPPACCDMSCLPTSIPHLPPFGPDHPNIA